MPKRRRKVVVHSLPDFDDGALAVLDELHRRGLAAIVLCERKAAASLAVDLGRPRVRAFGKNTWRGRYHFLTACVVVTTHGVFRTHRPPRGQVVVNIWHGEPLTKPVGRWDSAPAVQSTWATALSNVGKAFRCAEFDLDPAQVLVVGAPRNDRMLRTATDEVRRVALGRHEPRPMFLWLPTYRQGTWTGRLDGEQYAGALPLDDGSIAALDEWLTDRDATLITKPHPLAPRPRAGSYERIEVIDSEWMATRGLSLGNLLAAADCLITDVSSVWVDFLLLDRPMIFYFPDLQAYRDTRGLHLEPYEAWVPGPLIQAADELPAAMQSALSGADGHSDAREQQRSRLHRYTDDRSTQRLLDELGISVGETVQSRLGTETARA